MRGRKGEERFTVWCRGFEEKENKRVVRERRVVGERRGEE